MHPKTPAERFLSALEGAEDLAPMGYWLLAVLALCLAALLLTGC
jgi:hypothetical protein